MNRFLLAVSIGAVFAPVAWSQDKTVAEPLELFARREEYLRSMQRAAVPVLGAYLQTLETLKAQFTRDGQQEAALAVDNEIKAIRKQYDVATNAANEATVATMQLTIVAAKFGDPASHRVADVTKAVQKAFASGQPTMILSIKTLSPGQDPAPFIAKSLTVDYYINAQRKQKVFKDGATVNFRGDLQ